MGHAVLFCDNIQISSPYFDKISKPVVIYFDGEVNMEIEIYLDSLFVLNLIVNLWILELLRYKYSLNVKLIRVFAAAGVGAGVYIAMFFVPGNSLVLQLAGEATSLCMMTAVLLPKRKRRFFCKVLGMGIVYSLIIAGILRAVFVKWKLFSGKEVTVFAVLTGTFLCVKIGKWFLFREKGIRKKHIWKVTIVSSGENKNIQALLDTGNSLIEPISKKPVCLIEEELLAHITLENPLFLRVIPYRSIGCEQGLLYGVEIPRLEIFTDEGYYVAEHVICAGVGHKLSTKAAYQMILHPALITEENRRRERKELECC